ncbi:MAG: 2-oxo acid dehydrogenase subunit E2, partial [Actinobacteria bacterium]|nr:2-oxo acid dehydrogenase subunit E2 [Actinomycetota bacterium]
MTVQEPTRAQQVVARRMSSSKATIPEFTLAAEVDMERCVELRSRLRAIHGDRPVASYNDIVVKACGLALREHP